MFLAVPARTISQAAPVVETATKDCVRVRCIDDHDRGGEPTRHRWRSRSIACFAESQHGFDAQGGLPLSPDDALPPILRCIRNVSGHAPIPPLKVSRTIVSPL
jgi:hypothetical protein